MDNFLGKFSYTFSTTILLRTYEQLLTWICSLSFKRLFWLLYFDLVPPFYFLKWNRFFSTFILVLSESRHYLSYLLPKEVCTNLEIKRFPLMKFWYTICMSRGTDSKVTILKITQLINVYSLWRCLGRNLLLIRLIIITLF